MSALAVYLPFPWWLQHLGLLWVVKCGTGFSRGVRRPYTPQKNRHNFLTTGPLGMIRAPLESPLNGASGGAPRFSNRPFPDFTGALQAGWSAQAVLGRFGLRLVSPWLEAKGEADEALHPQARSCLGCVHTFRAGITMAEAMRGWQPRNQKMFCLFTADCTP